MLTAAPDASVDVGVLGAGPAGCAAALGLHRLRYSVAILGRPRPAASEGLGERCVARLLEAGLERAAAAAGRSAPRIGVWAGTRSTRGRECPIDRTAFDEALALDLALAGLRLDRRAARAIAADAGGGWRIDTAQGSLRCRAILDARGRRSGGVERLGPRLVAWSERWRIAAGGGPGSAVVAIDDGWCWFARDANGILQRQFICAPRTRLDREQLRERFETATATLQEDAFSTQRAQFLGARATAAVMRRADAAPSPGRLRIGDAALALDPLAGHGVHEALQSARVGVAAIHSYLDGTDWTPIARFVRERSDEVWRRAVATAGTFYREQARSLPGAPFWAAAADHYERLSVDANARIDAGAGRFERRPVLNGERIELRPVWVSARWPRGVWRAAVTRASREVRDEHDEQS
ncbi:MAG: hypothetical protein KGL36_11740 [Gammaproteobacteria bacterium]|nr:hypothetical protein [Gammaproteobacteria bacterium]